MWVRNIQNRAEKERVEMLLEARRNLQIEVFIFFAQFLRMPTLPLTECNFSVNVHHVCTPAIINGVCGVVGGSWAALIGYQRG